MNKYIIPKTASNTQNFLKPIFSFESARKAFEHILRYYKDIGDCTLFLPGYIGISPNEGSGIFDPVIATGINYVFYPIDKSLNIKLEVFTKMIQECRTQKIVLLVHYFGYPDEHIDEIVGICRDNNAVLIEDSAHALYTDYIDHSCGQYGDYVLYSLHKMLPFSDGGGMRVNTTVRSGLTECVEKSTKIFEYDLFGIAKKRKNNVKLWDELLSDKTEKIKVLHHYSDAVTPQTFPIIINGYDRNQLYFELNEARFGAVSLYHTMIKPIQEDSKLADGVWLSQHIINMPVHQDVENDQIKKMAEYLLELIRE